MRRAKKIAIVVTILAVGTALALCFRKPESETAQRDGSRVAGQATPQAGVSEARPAVDPSKRGSAYQPRDGIEAAPRLAGRIEPVSSPVLPIGPMGETPTRDYRQSLTSENITSLRQSAGIVAETDEKGEAGAAPPSPQAERKPLGWREPKSPFERGSGSSMTVDDRGEFSAATEPAGKHRIVDGDTLANLAVRYLGSSLRAADIYDYNRDVLTSIELLPIGKELRIPPQGYRRATVEPEVKPIHAVDRRSELHLVPIIAAEPPREMPNQRPAQLPIASGAAKPVSPPSDSTAYVVQPYDTLPLISRRVYGDLIHQNAIIAANSQQLRTAKDLRPGMTLILPNRSK